jgi:protein-disulfide isomerase
MDDPSLSQDDMPPAETPAEPPVTPAEHSDTPAEPPRASGVARAAALVGLGLLAGLGAGWALFHEDTAPLPSMDGPASVESPAVESHGIDVTNDPTLGSGEAPITIVEFSDFDCPFCTRFATLTAPALRRQYGDSIRWIFVNLPLQSLHPRAYEAALGGECAHEQGRFWEWYDAMFSGRFDTSDEGLSAAAGAIGLEADRFEQCVAKADYAREVAADLREAQKFYILGTPTFFINGQRLEGALPPEHFAAVIDSILSGT